VSVAEATTPKSRQRQRSVFLSPMFALAVGIILSTNYNVTAVVAQCLFVAGVCFGGGHYFVNELQRCGGGSAVFICRRCLLWCVGLALALVAFSSTASLFRVLAIATRPPLTLYCL
jgi:hypothetical protein